MEIYVSSAVCEGIFTIMLIGPVARNAMDGFGRKQLTGAWRHFKDELNAIRRP